MKVLNCNIKIFINLCLLIKLLANDFYDNRNTQTNEIYYLTNKSLKFMHEELYYKSERQEYKKNLKESAFNYNNNSGNYTSSLTKDKDLSINKKLSIFRNLELETLEKENITIGNCTYDTCFNGYCNSTKFCICDDGFETFPSNNTIGCNYLKYKVKVAFYLEFFLPFGIGHLYSERNEFGIFKIFLFIVSVAMLIIYVIIAKKKNSSETTELVIALNTFLIVPLYLMWHIIDIMLFGVNKYVDGNGIPLNDW